MGIGDRLRALDERFLPDRDEEPPRRIIWVVGFGFLGFLAISVGLIVPRLMSDPEPLGFSCMTPSQPVVEAVLGVDVSSSEAVGGTTSREATGTWTSDGTPIVHVICRSLLPNDLDGVRPSPGEAGYVESDPPFVRTQAEAEGFATELRFVHEHAEIRMQLSSEVDTGEARQLVESWSEQVRIFGGP